MSPIENKEPPLFEIWLHFLRLPFYLQLFGFYLVFE
jgi:hypothetical protein